MFDINKALKAVSDRFDDEARKEFDETSEQLRAVNISHLDPNSPEARKARAIQQEQDINLQIVMLTQEPESELKQRRLYQALDRLSELLAEQGDVRAAINVTPNAERKAYFESLTNVE